MKCMFMYLPMHIKNTHILVNYSRYFRAMWDKLSGLSPIGLIYQPLTPSTDKIYLSIKSVTSQAGWAYDPLLFVAVVFQVQLIIFLLFLDYSKGNEFSLHFCHIDILQNSRFFTNYSWVFLLCSSIFLYYLQLFILTQDICFYSLKFYFLGIIWPYLI